MAENRSRLNHGATPLVGLLGQDLSDPTRDFFRRYGLLSPQPPPEQGLMSPSLVRTDPALDARTILEMLMRPSPQRGFIDMIDQQDQYPIDNPNAPPEPEFPPLPFKRLIPPRDQW